MSSQEASERAGTTREAIALAFAEFLLVPTVVIVAFALLAAVTFRLDRSEAEWLAPARDALKAAIFANAGATADLLGTIAGGIITITSITVSLLLIALQQSASALTHQVYDQFLRNRMNQFYFGFFVGLSLFALATLSSVGPLNPVIGGTVALASTAVALYLLLVLFYTTVNQMRPVVIIEAIHHHALVAREAQRDFLLRTRRASELQAPVHVPVATSQHGFVTRIDVDAIEAATKRAAASVEVLLRVSVGTYVVFGQVLADVKAHTSSDAETVGKVLESAIRRQDKRDLAADPLDGVEELETIGWTSISTAQSDADSGVLTIYALRDLLARWCEPQSGSGNRPAAPVVYVDDVVPRVLNAFESLLVSASESMQHQSCAEILSTFEIVFARLRPQEQRHVEDIVLRSLAALGDHVLTSELERAIGRLVAVLEKAGRRETAKALRAATDALSRSIGKLNSRATRVPQ
jgi:uncharacterized membrane protein